MAIANKTLTAINDALILDQGAKFRGLLRRTIPLAEDAYNEKQEDFRSHLGASLIGRKCIRELWYSFRWVTRKTFDGRILRLFNRGHLEEARMVALLQMIGCNVFQFDQNGKQFRIIGHNGHFGGSMDSVIVGCPDLPEEPILGEFKTHNEKSFTKLREEGVIASKFEHFIQMQIYMGKNNLRFALYMATNKNTDEIYAELIAFDQRQYQGYLDRSVMIIDSLKPPPGISKLSSWYECKWCDQAEVCHGKALPARTCRSCQHSAPRENGEWFCTEPKADATFGDNVPLSKVAQLAACLDYEMIPEIKIK